MPKPSNETDFTAEKVDAAPLGAPADPARALDGSSSNAPKNSSAPKNSNKSRKNNGSRGHDAGLEAGLTPPPGADGRASAAPDTNHRSDSACMPGGRRQSPERRCIITGETGPKATFIRFVCDPDGVVTPDLAERLPGRGAWVSAEKSCVRKAARSGAFARAFKAPATAPADLDQLVEDALKARALSSLGLVRRAGLAALGFDEGSKVLRRGNAVFALSAIDASADGAEKLGRAAAAAGALFLRCFTVNEQSLAIGANAVRHLVVRHGSPAMSAKAALLKFCDYQGEALGAAQMKPPPT
ncbi:MAG: DUF448 domain-containing protein [Pseudomonadota bacterium]